MHRYTQCHEFAIWKRTVRNVIHECPAAHGVVCDLAPLPLHAQISNSAIMAKKRGAVAIKKGAASRRCGRRGTWCGDQSRGPISERFTLRSVPSAIRDSSEAARSARERFAARCCASTHCFASGESR